MGLETVIGLAFAMGRTLVTVNRISTYTRVTLTLVGLKKTRFIDVSLKA